MRGMRPLLSIAGAAIVALAAFRSLYSYDSLYPLTDGAVIGCTVYGCVKVAERLGSPRMPAWAMVPAAIVFTFAIYRAWHIALMV